MIFGLYYKKPRSANHRSDIRRDLLRYLLYHILLQLFKIIDRKKAAVTTLADGGASGYRLSETITYIAKCETKWANSTSNQLVYNRIGRNTSTLTLFLRMDYVLFMYAHRVCM